MPSTTPGRIPAFIFLCLVLAAGFAACMGLLLVGYHLGLSKALANSIILEPDFALKVLTDEDAQKNEQAYLIWLHGQNNCGLPSRAL